MSKGHVGAWIQSFLHKNALKFSEKVGIFPEKKFFLKISSLFMPGS